jgi:putative DNA primase/helicase
MQTPKPQANCSLELIERNFPSELIALPYWCLWRYEWREPKDSKPGKWTKVPYQTNGGHAESNNRETWNSFKTVKTTFPKGPFDGIGCFIAEPYIGVDLDWKNDLQAEGKEFAYIPEWAQKIVNLLGSYTEWSPSGKGMHVWVTGELPPGRRRAGRVEIYQTGRYFTVSGVLP